LPIKIGAEQNWHNHAHFLSLAAPWRRCIDAGLASPRHPTDTRAVHVGFGADVVAEKIFSGHGIAIPFFVPSLIRIITFHSFTAYAIAS
jgi:hypothetical protein